MNNKPLADRLRPKNLETFFGQKHILDKDKILYQMLKNNSLSSIIFWGPPGTGKTTLANIISNTIKANFINTSAVLIGVPEIKKIAKQALENSQLLKQKTILFLDEIHRFNKAQQDVLLPYVESGALILIGATTENPSFSINNALLSRCRVLDLKQLEDKELESILDNALKNEKGLKHLELKISKQAKKVITSFAGGDARSLLTALEIASSGKVKKELKTKDIQEAIQNSVLHYDKNGEEHFNIISALHKCLRDSDINASLYWLARMIEAGEDPLYIARRLIRFASEDVGEDYRALVIANHAKDAIHFLGTPEGNLALAQAVVYLAKAKKSNKLYTAYNKAAEDARKTSHLGVPLVLRNASTNFMKEIGYGNGYKYAPDSTEEEIKNQQHWPDKFKKKKYYK